METLAYNIFLLLISVFMLIGIGVLVIFSIYGLVCTYVSLKQEIKNIKQKYPK